MKFFKISLLLSIGFISFNTVPTSVLLDTGNPELERMAMDGVGATRTIAILPGVPTPKTAILPGVPTPKDFSAPINTKFQESLNNLQSTAMQKLAQQVADHIVKTYGQMVAKALVNQMFPPASKVVTPSASNKTTAQTLLNTLTVTLGQGMKDDIVAELKNRFYANPMQMLRSK